MGEPLNFEVAGVLLEPCCDPQPKAQVHQTQWGRDPLSSLNTRETGPYLLVPHEQCWIGAGPRVFHVRGHHRFRDTFDQVCLECVLTGELFDIRADRYSNATLAHGPWEILVSPMEVLAWVSL